MHTLLRSCHSWENDARVLCMVWEWYFSGVAMFCKWYFSGVAKIVKLQFRKRIYEFTGGVDRENAPQHRSRQAQACLPHWTAPRSPTSPCCAHRGPPGARSLTEHIEPKMRTRTYQKSLKTTRMLSLKLWNAWTFVVWNCETVVKRLEFRTAKTLIGCETLGILNCKTLLVKNAWNCETVGILEFWNPNLEFWTPEFWTAKTLNCNTLGILEFWNANLEFKSPILDSKIPNSNELQLKNAWNFTIKKRLEFCN